MWSDVEKLVSRVARGGKHRRRPVDNECGQMCTNSREAHDEARWRAAIQSPFFRRFFVSISTDFSRKQVTDSQLMWCRAFVDN